MVNLDTDFVITRTGAFGENVGIEVIIDFLISLPENVIFVLMGNLPDYFLCFTRDLVREFGLGSHVLITSYIGHAVHFRPPNYRDRLI